ncbi:hypothetical protein V7O66_04860 [Methanolobus sp. ZRKC3]|uniref:hypothetical protein n=1 Tax=Methanolobus sp. ZRKC3 TaxID=3125786 RepID=UPI003248062E
MMNNEAYKTRSDLYELELKRTEAIESKAANVATFAGAILALEYTILSDFYENFSNFGAVYKLIAISTGFFIAAIVLGMITIVGKKRSAAETLGIIEGCVNDNEGLAKACPKLSSDIKEISEKNDDKLKYFGGSISSFFLGVVSAGILIIGIVISL